MQDRNENKLFYLHRPTGETQRELPMDAFVPCTPGKPIWKPIWDDDYQRNYWYNESSGESQWVRPNGALVDDHSITSTSNQETLITEGDWRVLKDKLTNRIYYYNAKTGMSQWEKPVDIMVMLSDSVSTELWEQHRDPVTKRVFYYNKQDGTTQWELPEGMHPETDTPEEWEKFKDTNSDGCTFSIRVMDEQAGIAPHLKRRSLCGRSSKTNLLEEVIIQMN